MSMPLHDDDIQYFACSRASTTPLLLRRIGVADHKAFLHGVWQPTKIIINYMFGHDDFVDEISEAEARALEPAAFGTAAREVDWLTPADKERRRELLEAAIRVSATIPVPPGADTVC